MTVDPVKASEVKDAKTFCAWAQAAYGAPYPRQQDFSILGKKAQHLFENNPGTDWQTLVQVVKWCHKNKRRFGRIWSYVGQYPFAWADGALDVEHITTLDEKIADAISLETDPAWRAQLRRASGEARADVLDEWIAVRGSTISG